MSLLNIVCIHCMFVSKATPCRRWSWMLVCQRPWILVRPDHPLHCAMYLVHKILNIGGTQPSNSGRPMHNIYILLCCTEILNIGQCWSYCAADHYHKLFWLYFLYILISATILTPKNFINIEYSQLLLSLHMDATPGVLQLSCWASDAPLIALSIAFDSLKHWASLLIHYSMEHCLIKSEEGSKWDHIMQLEMRWRWRGKKTDLTSWQSNQFWRASTDSADDLIWSCARLPATNI